ncbi:unnamed protein product, partial [Rotaria sp. Silwood1]
CGRRSVISIDDVLVPRPTPNKVFAKFLNPSPFTTSNARASRAQNSVQASVAENLIFLGIGDGFKEE